MDAAARDALLPAIAAGDVQAFASWLAQGEPRIRLSLARFARVVDVEAVLQETLLRLWQLAPRVVIDERGDSLLRLGVQIAHNLSVDHVRRARREERFEADEDTCDADFADPLLREVIRGCIEKLPPQPRAALDLRLESGGSEPDADLAEKLAMRPNTFLKNFGRARQLLLECLERAGVALGLKAERA